MNPLCAFGILKGTSFTMIVTFYTRVIIPLRITILGGHFSHYLSWSVCISAAVSHAPHYQWH